MVDVIRDRDLGLKRIVKQFKASPVLETLSVGVQGSSGDADHGGITTSTLATIHEFGAPSVNIPERAFLRGTFDRNSKKYEALFSKAARSLARGRRTRPMIKKIGEIAVADVVQTINSSIDLAPLKPATIAREGSSKPLLELRDSVTWVLE
ncbi:MAG: hypothetical protein MJA83_05600 [Gammaproteobacteria bacterium]|nr:hypothetical protein [Gammaproteobacteria bacterium]